MKTMIGLLSMLLSFPSLGNCRILTESEFSALLTPKIKRIIFFASWCKSCEKHLSEADVGSSLFVATFDDQAKADEVLKLHFRDRMDSITCVFDQDRRVGEKYGVKFLPFIKEL